ncbi:MAG: hypothetical protein A2736_00735 [Candidatus Yanofskybacteria bacterium RIFCSPHIGHO2_01_FULL_41_27]|uniref:NYN domain-containing protein n=3 Tax=Candidatus Yanofskyibacteriota TaxID=1752733 RepID=A0A1F8HV35_9BACT|nr:MAG: hypothetical protein UU84_C0016G0005 [Candidatus Yanofskybacteria bacterium GW2011_GWC2_41_9]OGN00288.1 MAG: hypothetical protein A2736_00735 [Candidatus Yanofskybacteria bacterium RIFCSPHIGHO2_01_FULL_41_27]OGN10407.1 MAG: hypothetical protein A3C64_02680 [Candidatus Yanofskybacteria bacterium RIFCSPHIGHO2_02_FULL_41_12]OGN19907.1 MAG: hypothetical protein A3B00_00160 [Candidatus Yanofskybacteria bacterium RIFCSPLOWO2_01_FULL_41_33]OGN40999.1 MAG: hypothetical protein A2606_03455 [Cand
MTSPQDPVKTAEKTESTLKRKPKIFKQPPQKRIFAVFMDYKNLDDGLPGGTRKFSDFSWLINPILEQGIIAFAYVFIPDNYAGRAEIYQLSDKHDFLPILCTRKTKNGIMKNGDTVDAKMEREAIKLIIHSDITDITIVSGDADFQGLINFAIHNQKRVTVVPAAKACSERFFEMAETGKIKLEVVR